MIELKVQQWLLEWLSLFSSLSLSLQIPSKHFESTTVAIKMVNVYPCFHLYLCLCKFLQSILKVQQPLVDWLSTDPSYCLTGTTTTTVDNIKQRLSKFDFFKSFNSLNFLITLDRMDCQSALSIPTNSKATGHCIQSYWAFFGIHDANWLIE